jgi:hypothetical protein
MTAIHTKRLRDAVRWWGRRARTLRATPPRAQFCVFALAALISLSGAASIRGEDNPPVEYQVKAAFLYNFTKFVEWPSDAFQSETAPIVICVFGHDPFSGALDEIVQGKMINRRELLVRRTDKFPDLKTCHLVFVSATESKGLSEILNSVKGSSALVVGESDGFAERGGGIQFFFVENKLRFSVNVDAIQRARLTLSSKLLTLARIVHDEARPKGD